MYSQILLAPSEPNDSELFGVADSGTTEYFITEDILCEQKMIAVFPLPVKIPSLHPHMTS